MTESTRNLDSPLEAAVNQLHLICSEPRLLDSSIDTGSVQRIAVHITNINSSVRASTRDHVNAAKRLNDFAITLARMARKAVQPSDELTVRMSSVATTLRAASEELARSKGIPSW
jgi:hypothetical protein